MWNELTGIRKQIDYDQVKMEAMFVQREKKTQKDPGEVDLKTLPQATIRKVIKEYVEKGLFDANLHIDSRPMLDYVPQMSQTDSGPNRGMAAKR